MVNTQDTWNIYAAICWWPTLAKSPIFVLSCIYGSGFRSLAYGIGLVPLSRAQLSKDNTSVSLPSNNSCLMRKEILPHFDCLEMENVNIIVRRAEFSLNVEKKVQSPDWLCCVSGFIPFAGIWSSVTQQQSQAGFLQKTIVGGIFLQKSSLETTADSR